MKFLKSRSVSPVPELTGGAEGDGAARDVELEETLLKEMSFLDHLEELRWSILKALAGVLVATIACTFFSAWIIDVILIGPTRPSFFTYQWFGVDAVEVDLQNRTITGQFFAYWGTVVVVGLILGSPIIVYQLWRFIEPGLYRREKQGLRFISVFATFFFIVGILFGYGIITPLALQFFATFQISERIVNEFDITRYFSMVTTLAFGVGVLFELPVIIYFLSKLRIVTPAILRKSRKYALIVMLILAAFLTPPEPVSQLLVALPLMVLYEISIYISAYVNKREEKRLARALG